MTIRNKLIISFLSLVGVLLIFGGLSWKYISMLDDQIAEVKEWRVPAAHLVVNVHAGAYDATIEQLRYLLYEKPEIHEDAKAVLAKMTKDLADVDTLAYKFNDEALLSQSAAVKKNVIDFGGLYERGVASLKDNKKAVTVMVASGEAVLYEADAFALKQEKEYAILMNTGGSALLLDDKVQKYITVNQIKSLAHTIIRHEKQERLQKNRKYYRMMQTELPMLLGLYDILKRKTNDTSELKQIQTARIATENYARAAEKWIANDDALVGILIEMNQIASDARNSAEAAENNAWKNVEGLGVRAGNIAAEAKIIIAVTLIVGFIIGVMLAMIISNQIVASINALSGFARSFGKGNLKARSHFQPTDEIGEMGNLFDGAAKNLQNSMTSIVSHSYALATHAEELSTSVEAGLSNIDIQQKTTDTVSVSMSDMSITVKDVLDAASKASVAAENTNNQAIEGNVIVAQSVDSINALATEINIATTVIEKLEADVGDISSILEVIRSVSEQTNLLALNAAIEAARAGEHGRGFAVVADEVRTLASRTQSSTDEIQAMIEKLQLGAKSAVKAMSSSQEIAVTSVEQAKNSGEALVAITQGIVEINEMNSYIVNSASKQATVTDDISKDIHSIGDLFTLNVNSAHHHLESSRELAKLSDELQGLVNQFKI